MVSESCEWLLEILIWTKRCNFSTSGFERSRSKIWGCSKYQSRREFCKLSKQSGNSELWHQTNHGALKLERFSRYDLELESICSFFWFSRFASWCNMSVWCYATCQPYTFLTKRKGLIKYIWHTHSRWQFALNPMISSNDTIYEMWLAYPHKSIIYIYTDTSPLIPQVAPVCLMLHK
jgi:hypothetical protein